MENDNPIISELRATGASIVLAIAAAENGDWVAAEQGVIDAQQRVPTVLKELQLKIAEPPGVGGGDIDD